MTERLRRKDGHKCRCREMGRAYCIDHLLPEQAWALWEASIVGGLLGQIGVGAGKTVIDILFAMVIKDCWVAALFVPPGLTGQLATEYAFVAEHFDVPSLIMPPGVDGGAIFPPEMRRPVIHVVPYSRFSREEATAYLMSLKPDTCAGDEAHAFKCPTSVRTSRYLAYYGERPETRALNWSGTIVTDTIKDFSHLLAFALGERSPLPLDPHVVDEWAAATDPSDFPALSGELDQLRAPGESLLHAVRRRIFETEGVISTGNASAGPVVVLKDRKPPAMPKEIKHHLKELETLWVRPDGEELVDALAVARAQRELVSGFFYKWHFPGKPDLALVEEWFSARKEWRKELREKLKRPRPYLDSPLLCARAAMRAWGTNATDEEDDLEADERELPLDGVELPIWHAETWPRWAEVKDKLPHVTVPVWVSDYLVEDAAQWAHTHRGVVWYEHRAFGERLGTLTGIPVHGGGPGAEARILAEKGNRSIAASIKSHGEGRDGLQRLYNKQLVECFPASAKKVEQLFGRLSRKGQAAPQIETWAYRHHACLRDDFDRALKRARFVEGLTSSTQKLLTAVVEW